MANPMVVVVVVVVVVGVVEVGADTRSVCLWGGGAGRGREVLNACILSFIFHL